MPKDPSSLTSRMLAPEEIETINSARKKAITLEWLKQQLVDPQTQEPIQVGQGIEIGPFDNEAEGKNWIKYYLPDATRGMQWGKSVTKGGHRMSPTASEAVKKEGRVYMRIIRIRE